MMLVSIVSKPMDTQHFSISKHTCTPHVSSSHHMHTTCLFTTSPHHMHTTRVFNTLNHTTHVHLTFVFTLRTCSAVLTCTQHSPLFRGMKLDLQPLSRLRKHRILLVQQCIPLRYVSLQACDRGRIFLNHRLHLISFLGDGTCHHLHRVHRARGVSRWCRLRRTAFTTTLKDTAMTSRCALFVHGGVQEAIL